MEKLLTLLADVRPDVDFATAQNLVTDGIIDSLDLVTIIGELKAEYAVNISVLDIVPENFDSAQAMLALITKLSK